MADATSLFDAADELLTAAVAAVAESPGGPIARFYVSPGIPAWDAEQITVHAGTAVIADTSPLQPPLQPFHRVSEVGLLNMVAFVITVIRPVHIGQYDGEGNMLSAPMPADIDKDAQIVLGDLWAIWNYVNAAKRAGHLFVAPDGTAKTREFTWDPAVPLPTSGGYGGWQMQCRTQLDGFAPALTT